MQTKFIFNFEDTIVDLEHIKEKVQKKSDLMKKISLFMRSEVQKNFDAEGRPERWKPLSPNYLKEKRALKGGGAGKILVFSGDLRRSFNVFSDNDTAEVFTGAQYGIKHQLGIGVPRRAFMPDEKSPDMPPFDIDSLNVIKEMIGRWLTG